MADTGKVVFKKFSKSKMSSTRKKQKGSDSGSEKQSESSTSEDDTTIVQRTKITRKNPMVQSTSGAAKKRRTEYRSSSTSGESDSEERVNPLGVQYESSKTESKGPQDMGATATLETETDFAVDSQAQFEKAQETAKDAKGKADDRVYRGMGAYGQFIEKRDTAAGKASSGFVRKGPIRAPTNLRQTVRWDYAPDICKDYKETGFCTFGDSCKFLHDRSDYKHGWELEREWAEGRYGKDDEDPEKYEISSDEDQLPFKCYICRETFTQPVVTKCGHYFCEKCALSEYRKSQKCVVCDKNTGGVFNPAKELIARLKGEATKKRRRKSRESSKSADEDEGNEAETPMEKLPPQEEEEGEQERSDSEESSESGQD